MLEKNKYHSRMDYVFKKGNYEDINLELGQKIFFLARQKAMFMKQIVKENDFKIIDMATMSVVDHMPGSSQEYIRDITSFDEASIARTLKNLEDRHLIERTVNPKNKRLKMVRLTPEGKLVSQKFKEIMDFWDDKLLSDLTTAERKEFGLLIDKALVDSEKVGVDHMLSEWRKKNE